MTIEELYTLYVSIVDEMISLVERINTSPHTLSVRTKHAFGGSLKFADAFSMAKILMDRKPKSLLEVGSFIGMSTRWTCEIVRRIQNEAEGGWQLTAVDPNMRHRVFDNPKELVEALNMVFIPDRLEIVTAFFGTLPFSMHWYTCQEANPKLDRKTVENLLSGLPHITGEWDRKFDCIFIDANHSYNSVHENFVQAVKLLNPKGTILFHDVLTWKDVNKALMEIKEMWQGRALLEILDSRFVLSHPAVVENSIGSSTCDGIGVFTLL